MIEKRLSIRAIVLASSLILGCQNAPDTVLAPPSASGPTRFGVVDLGRCFDTRSCPKLKELEAAQGRWYQSLPEETLKLIRTRTTVREQIEALPIETSLRTEKVRQLIKLSSDLLRDEQWMTYQASCKIGLETIAIAIHNCITRCATSKSLAFVYVLNRPVPDESGMELFVRTSGTVPFSRYPDAYDLTNDVLALLKRGESERPLTMDTTALPHIIEEPKFDPKEPDRGLYASPIK